VDWSVTGRLAGGSIPATILTLFALYILGIKGNDSSPLITTALGIALVMTSRVTSVATAMQSPPADNDLCAFRRHRARCGAADARPGASDQRDLAIQPSHRKTPLPAKFQRELVYPIHSQQ
jgi:hypothetical protein